MNTDYTKFKNALLRLQERHDDYLKACNLPDLPKAYRESLQESCIQRFEVCFDTLHKHLKKYLKEELGLAEIASAPKPIFRKAHQSQIIDNIDLWMDYTNKRNDTSHDYSEKKAQQALSILPSFLESSIVLYELMTGQKWGK